ncbi:hypothetical protein Syun_001895 [Stephania yunnanensis]|uniref:Uncharacterized protein n=1 Tax=Stephania yunnanensis TaxID=152371 RepID=A0AAP0LHN2_9MAGN
MDEVDIQVEQEPLPNINSEPDEDEIDEEVYNQELADKDDSNNDVDDIDDAVVLQKVQLQSDEDDY